MNGTIQVDFAGTLDEAKLFAATFGHNFPHGLTTGRGGAEASPNGDPMLFARYETKAERLKIRHAFEKLTWSVSDQKDSLEGK